MKRLVLTFVAAIATVAASFAQKYMVVDSEKIFKSIEAYNTAIATLDTLAEESQKQVDAKFQEVETLYNQYQSVRATLSAERRQVYEDTILAREKEANQFQESVFGQNGSLMKRRLELIQPIQKRVFDAISTYAQANGFDLVLDSASNPSLLYSAPGLDRTEAIVKALK